MNYDEYNNIRKGRKVKNVFKNIAFVLIAMIFGAIGAYIFVDSKLEGINYNKIQTKNKNIINTSSKTWGNSVNKVATTVGPAVVGISNKKESFFGETSGGSGSGIIFDSKGYIVTNNHVIEGADKITVKLSSGKVYEASLIGKDPRTDLAVIKVDAKNLPVAKFGDSSKVKVGDLAVAIGNPLGDEFSGSVTSGIISAVNRKLFVGEAEYKVLQTDAAINPGNSGGALCNEDGEIIGINSLKLGSQVNAEGMGFAITINSAKKVVDSLMKYGIVSRPELGIYGRTVESEDGKFKGIGVQDILPGSGAEKSGIKPGDVILEFDGKKVSNIDELRQILENHKIGDKIDSKVWRNGRIISVPIILSDSSKTGGGDNQIMR